MGVRETAHRNTAKKIAISANARLVAPVSSYGCICILDDDLIGAGCEYNDYISSFQIIFWTSLVLIFTLAATIMSMYSAGEDKTH